MLSLSSAANKIMLVTLVEKGRRRNLRTDYFQGTENKNEEDAFNKARNFRISQPPYAATTEFKPRLGKSRDKPYAGQTNDSEN
jgi:hypothetical protein